ncbi:MAG: 3-deoxy-7-phosphoheptulonate synthase, partial [Pseudomonadales bacterium]
MKYLTDDLRITGMEEVTAPEDLSAELPISDDTSRLIFSARQQISEILHGTDPRLLVVVGPCSIHDPKTAIDYAGQLAAIAEEL